MNVSNYSESENAFDTVGDFYNETGDIANAVNCFKQALVIKEITETRKKLNEPQKKN